MILVLTETEHTVLLIDKYWLQAAILVMSSSETTVRQLLCERSDETLVLAAFLCADSGAIAHANSAVLVSTGIKRHGRSLTTTRNVKREKRSFTSDFANLMVACPVLTRSVFVWMRMRRSLWISGANVNEEQYPQVLTRRFLDEEERRNICRRKSSFTGLISVYREDGVCCVFDLVGESRCVPTDS